MCGTNHPTSNRPGAMTAHDMAGPDQELSTPREDAGTQAGKRARGSVAGLCLLVALAVIPVILVRFTPRIAYWQGLNIPGVVQRSEYGRAKVTLGQIADPWTVPSSQFHEHVRWRLFFPVLWHYLHLPIWLLLAMPMIGCIPVLWLVCRLTLERTGSWWMAVIATCGFAVLPWFFVSTGWLTYFDSWLMLAMLVAAFVPSRAALAAACLLAPWIDERFVLALPAIAVVRAIALDRFAAPALREYAQDLTVIILASFPYLAIRAVIWLRGEATTDYYVQSHWAEVLTVPVTTLLAGWWSGFRLEWIFVAAAIALTIRQAGWLWGALLAGAVALMIVIGLYISADMSRNLMAIAPVLLLGIWQWDAWRTASLAWALPLIVAMNLVLPATHVMWDRTVPIAYLPTQLRELQNPPVFFAAARMIGEAGDLLNAGQVAAGWAKLDEALALERDYPDALATRAGLRMQEGNYRDAATDLEHVIELDPHHRTGHFLRGVVRGSRGEMAAAADDFRQALDGAPPDWQFREPAEDFLRQAEQSLREGSEPR